MSIYKRYADNTKCMHCMIRDEYIFDKYMIIWENVCNIIKSIFNSELIYNKKYLNIEKRFNKKKAFNVFIYQ